MVVVNKTVAVVVAVMLGGCSIYGGDDVAPDAGGIGSATIDGGWGLAVNLNPCLATPAAVRVDVGVNGEDVSATVQGDAVVEVTIQRNDVAGRVHIEAESGAAWDIDLYDDGEVYEATIAWDDGDCALANVAATVTARER